MPVMDPESKQWALFCHLAGFAGYVFPFGSILGPLIVWLAKKDSSPFVDGQGREAINFQLSMLVLELISLVLVLVIIGFFMLAALEIFKVIVMVVAIMRVSSGEGYRYPLTIRFV